MSNSYYVYTELWTGDRWVCINPHYVSNDSDLDELRLAETFWAGSRSYFRSTWDKMRDLCLFTQNLPYPETEEQEEKLRNTLKNLALSKTLEEYFTGENLPIQLLCVHEEAMRNCMPKSIQHECRGYYLKDDIFLYEAGEIEELTSPEELASVPAKDIDPNLYQFYEWDSPYGWIGNFREILEHVKWQVYGWQQANCEVNGGPHEIRLIVALY